MVAIFHECPNKCGRSVKDIDFQSVNNFPDSARARVDRRAFKQDNGSCVGQSAVHSARVTSNPSQVSRREEYIAVSEGEHAFERQVGIHKVTDSRVNNALWFACAATNQGVSLLMTVPVNIYLV